MQFFLTDLEGSGLKFSPYPEMDKQFKQRETTYFSLGLPLVILENLLTQDITKSDIPKSELKTKLSKELKRYGDSLNYSSSDWKNLKNLGFEEFAERVNTKTREFEAHISGHT